MPKGKTSNTGLKREDCERVEPEQMTFKLFQDGTITKDDVLFARNAVERKDELGTYDYVLVSDNKYLDGVEGSLTIYKE